jgi:hypothetical protein
MKEKQVEENKKAKLSPRDKRRFYKARRRIVRARLIDFEAQQAVYFGYPPLGAIKHFMTNKTIKRYMTERFSQQSEANKRSLERTVERQLRKRRK